MGSLVSNLASAVPALSTGLQVARSLNQAVAARAEARASQQALQERRDGVLEQDVMDREKTVAANQDLADSTTRQVEALTAQHDAAERARKAALRRAVAASNASAAARGLSPGEGSGEALLLGLTQESAAAGEESARATGLKSDAIRAAAAAEARANLLELDQAARKRRLSYLMSTEG
jgi:colicin import membrane protein